MDAKVIENERTAMAQKITRQPDGPGKRIGKKGEISFIGKLVPGAAKLFRERLPQIQAEAGYWEPRVGTVHDFRATLPTSGYRCRSAPRGSRAGCQLCPPNMPPPLGSAVSARGTIDGGLPISG